MRPLCALISSVALFPLVLSANLDFEQDKIVHQATLDETEYVAKFPFTNTGTDSIEILKVASSCGCTTALPSQRVFKPGESGEITATFDYQSRQGKQIKTIRVETNQENDPRIELRLEVEIPTALEVSPSVVMWNRARETEMAPKEVIIQSNLPDPIEIVEVIGSSDLFSSEIKVMEAGKKFALSVVPENLPADAKGILRGTFLVKTNYANPTKSTLKVYAIVR
ncbi:MAG: DUF1573 domain-containing protein [Verrucomicrobiae bacterium]|nr:DUF1573 domain-containing protein [Verrucomicrobiae bacterium]